MKEVVKKPWNYTRDGILTETRLNQLSISKLKQEYFKLAEVLIKERAFCRYQSHRIRGYQSRLKRRKRRRIAMLRRRVLKASYIRRRVQQQHRVEIRKTKALLKKKAVVLIRKSVQERLKRAKKVIPRRLAKERKRIRQYNLIRINRSRKTIQRKLSRRTSLKIYKATELAKENAFIGLIKKEKLPGLGRYIGVYSMIARRVAIALNIKFDRLCFMLWIGNFESFNSGSLAIMYPGINYTHIRLLILYFVHIGYLQHIGKFRRRKTYAFTPLGKEFYDRVVRYMKRFKKPYRGKQITKKMVRVHFKMKGNAKS